jgi:hypothetical protein
MRKACYGLGGTVVGGLGLTHIAESLAYDSDRAKDRRAPPKSIIFLWMQGGPSQLETFDPHPNKLIGGETRGIATSLKGVQIADTLPHIAEIMHHAALVRSVVSREGDHERATYNMKTGWRPDPTLIHPAIGSVLCHQSSDSVEIPRHVSILSNEWPARGGYLGSSYDAFQIQDPKEPLPNLVNYSDPAVLERRLHDLESVVEREFRRGRIKNLDQDKTLHETSTKRARVMMTSDQIKAFDISNEGARIVASFGDTPFGRGCLAAIRLVEQGVRCVEVELSGWDSHINNHELQAGRCKILDSALSALIAQLMERDLFDSTVVVCSGEFGRTPKINVTGGRDHWPTGFSTLIAGGGFRRGVVHGETASDLPDEKSPLNGVADPVKVEDLHATILSSFGIDFEQQLQTPIGRPLAISQGTVVKNLISG